VSTPPQGSPRRVASAVAASGNGSLRAGTSGSGGSSSGDLLATQLKLQAALLATQPDC